ncbi:Alpha/Beta hydrolase protein [Triangularia verruculosa]|uniref:Alpha/Beta hydrolase protein n=1 Tax=Triangularia verruculosa TaxID=2587418 RepID=A0AAN6XSA9_9PEZI|nr:Alpha/Beta hydrolase protein [Triangularia verruculosa]
MISLAPRATALRLVAKRTAVATPSLYQTMKMRYSTVPLAYDLHEPAKPSVDNPNKNSPIVFMHGLFGSKKNNRTISKVLARDLGRSVYAIDLRNHGDSPHDPHHNYTAMAADVTDFIKQHDLKDPCLIGHSMGAKAAMTLSLDHPDLVSSVISVDNAPVDARLESDFARYIRGMKEIESSDVTKQSQADAILQPYEPSVTIRQFLLGNLHRPRHPDSQVQKFKVPLSIIGKALDHMGDFPYKDPREVRFEKPALFVRGTKSKYVPDEVIPLIGQFFPRFELVDVEAGHWLISENPEAFRRAVVEFLSPKE